MKKIIFLLLFLINTLAFSQLSISGTSIAADCPGNGSITVSASGGTAPYQYRLMSGPTENGPYPTSYVSSNVFSSLRAGNFVVQVRDAVNVTANSATITVANAYTPMNNPTVTQTVSHIGSCAVKQVTVNKLGVGKAPFSYELITGSTPIYGPQSSNIFPNVAPGNYTARITDACGEIRTSTTFAVTALDYKFDPNNATLDQSLLAVHSPDPFYTPGIVPPITNRPFLMDDCQTLAIRLDPNTEYASNGAPPMPENINRRVYVEDLTNNTIVQDVTFKPSDYPGGNTGPTIYLQKNTPYRFYLDDLCNDVVQVDRNYNYNVHDNWTLLAFAYRDGCNAYYLELTANLPLVNSYISSKKVKFKIISSTAPGDPVVGNEYEYDPTDVSQNQTPGRIARFYGITKGATYSIEVDNGCSPPYILTKTATEIVFNGTVINPNMNNNIVCVENTKSIGFIYRNLPLGQAGNLTWSINSGPATFTSENTGVTTNINYPVTGSYYHNGSSSEAYLPYISHFAVGTYNITLTNTCGDNHNFNYTVTEESVVKLDVSSLSTNSICSGIDNIVVNYSEYQNVSAVSNFRIKIEKQNGSGWDLVKDIALGTGPYSVNTAGIHRVTIYANPSSYDDGPIPTDACEIFYQGEIEVFDYRNPIILPESNGYLCTPGGNDGRVIIYADLGVQPYTYQMLDSSNNVILSQTNNTFTGLAAGIYRFRVLDNCGNAVVQNIEVDELDNPTFILDGTFCVGDDSSITAVPIADPSDIQYSWIGPNGFSSDQQTIQFNPITNDDLGTYTCTQTIISCGVSHSSSITINNCSVASSTPIAEDDSFSVITGNVLNTTVITNDTPSIDLPNIWSLPVLNGGASHGVVTMNPDGSFAYTPNSGYIGTDTFQYQICDSDGDCDTATVTITISGTYCYKPGLTTGGDILDAKHGITSLGRAGKDDADNWPLVRKGAWTVLEAKTKGFVINRISTTNQVEAIANPIEGMLVYDMEADCLKMFTSSDNGVTFSWKCMSKQACPDY